MAQIRYAEHYHRHAQVTQVLKQLKKCYKILENSSNPYADIALTGIEDLDYGIVQYYFTSQYESLNGRMTKAVEHYRECQEMNYYEDLTSFQFMIELNKALELIKTYPDIPFKTVEFEFKSEDAEKRLEECKSYFKENPVTGFNLQYYVIGDEIEWFITSICFRKEDLLNGTSLKLKYQ
ncbi:MAG: hypothetical protein H7325_09700 [Pedobacter sp.]|nr:hypothetical protein [Pedobacter sp.]